MELNAFAISGLFIFMTSVLMGVTLFVMGRSWEQRLWGIFCFAVSLWGLGGFFIGTTTTQGFALGFWKLAYVGVISIPPVFAHFVYVFLGRPRSWFVNAAYAAGAFFLLALLFSSAFISNVHLVFGSFYYLSPTPLYDLFLLFFIGTTIYTHILLFRAFKSSDAERKLQIQYFFIATFLGYVGGSFSFLPVYGVEFYPYLNFCVAFYPLIMGYAIFKYKLFDVRVVTTVLFVVLLVVFLLARVVVSEPYSLDQIFDIVLLVATSVIGSVLVRSVLGEIRAREQVEKLAKQLESANEKLKEVDQLKSEFLSIASHQLRAPITAIRGYASLILQGDYGAVSEQVHEPLSRIGDSARNMANSIEDYLNISRIEQHRMKFEKSTFDLADIAKKTVEELEQVAKRRGLSLTLEAGGPVKVTADVGKIKQVVSNLVDNAIKYTEKGSVTVSVKAEGGKARVTVADTGMGIPKEEIGGLFEKFKRARGANQVNTTGTGLGLYVAKQLVEGHQGRIWAESDGPGRGSRFIFELPI